MKFSTSSRRRLLIGTCLATLAGSPMPAAAQAQDMPSANQSNWDPHAELVVRPGTYETGGAVEIFVPMAQDEDSLLFVDARIGVSTEADYYGNWGLGFRQIVTPDLLIGGYGFFDATRAETGQDYYAVTFGAELLTTDFDLRANVHIPTSDGQFVSTTVADSGTAMVMDNRIVESFATQRIDEAAMTGFDVEAGVRLFSDEDDTQEFRLFAGAYRYWSDSVEDLTGGRARAEYRIHDAFGLTGSQLNIGAEVTHDGDRGTEASGNIRLRIPLGGSRSAARRANLTPIQRRATERVRRELPVRTRQRITTGTLNRAAIDARTGAAFGPVYFADGANTLGAGSSDDPTTLSDAIARAGINGIIVGEGNNGEITTDGVTLANGQQLVGGGTTVQVRLRNGGLQDLALGEAAGTIANGSPATDTIILSNGNLIRNLSLTGGRNAIAGSGVSAVAIDAVTTTGPAGTGITLDDIGAISITNSVIGGGTAGGVMITSGAGDTVLALAGNAVSATGGNVVSLDGSAGAGSLTVTDLTDTTILGGNGETGGLIAESIAFDADPATTGIQTVAGGDLAAGSAADRIGGPGVSLNNVSGGVAFGDVSVFTDGGAGLFIRDAGGKAGSFAFANTSGTIDAIGGAATDIDPVTLNSVFDSLTSSGSANFGVNLDTVAGTFTVTGATTVSDAAVTGIRIAGPNGDIVFGDTDIAMTDATTGVDVSMAEGNVTFATLDIAGDGTAGSVGIDMAGSTNSGDIVTTESGDITGVDIGVDLTTAAITGSFQYGDGSNTDADGAASTIQATTPIVFMGLGATGDYNFLDASVVGDTSNLAGNNTTLFFIDSTAGAGTAADPGSVAQAEASGADIFVLVNDGTGTIDSVASGGDDTFLLTAGQQVFSFLNQSSFDVLQGGTPVNLRVNGFASGDRVTIDDPTGNGAAELVSTLGDALTLGGSNMIDNVLIGDSANAGIVIGNLSDPSTITNSTISSVGISGGSGTVGITDSLVGSVTIDGGSTDVTIANSMIAQNGLDAAISVTNGHIGTFVVDAASTVTATNGDGIQFDNADGAYDFAGAITLNDSDAGINILNGSSGTFNFDGATSIINDLSLDQGIRINDSMANVTFDGFVDIDLSGGLSTGIQIRNSAGGNFSFNGGLDILIDDLGTAVDASGGGSLTIGGSDNDITAFASGVFVSDMDIALNFDTVTSIIESAAIFLRNVDGTIDVTGQISSGGFTGGAAGIAIIDSSVDASFAVVELEEQSLTIERSTGTVTFTDTVTVTNPAAIAIDITGTNGDIGFADVVITGLGASTGIDLTGAEGNIGFASIDITGTDAVGSTGIDLSNSTNSGNITTTNPSSITGAETGVDISNANVTGTFQFGDGSDVDANGKASTITATTSIDATGVGATGTYNFLDVDFGGSNPGGATGVFDVPTFFYFADTAQGAGDGSSAANAGTVADAEAASADALIPVGAAANAIDVDTGIGTNALDLDDAQDLLGFAPGEDTIDLGVAGPANVLLSAMLGQAMNIHADGSPALTQGTGGAVVTLANGNMIDSITIDNSGGNAATGLSGNAINNLMVSDLTIAGTVAGIDLSAATGMLMFDDTTVNVTTGAGISLTTSPAAAFGFTGGLDIDTASGTGLIATGGGTLSIVGADNTIDVTEGRALIFNSMTLDTTFASVNSALTTGGLTNIDIDNSDGSFTVNAATLRTVTNSSYANIDITQNDGTATRSLTVTLDNIDIAQAAAAPFVLIASEFGIRVQTMGDDAAIVAITNSTIQSEDSAVRLLGFNDRITVTDFSNITLLSDATAAEPRFFNNGVAFEGVIFDSDLTTAGLQEVQGGVFAAGTVATPVASGLIFSTNDTGNGSQGSIVFDEYRVNAFDSGLSLSGDQSALTVRILDGDIMAAGIFLDPTTSTAVDITLASLTLVSNDVTIGTGLTANNLTGSFTVTGAARITAPEQNIGTGPFGIRSPVNAIGISNSAAAFQFNSIDVLTTNMPSTFGGTQVRQLTTGGATTGISLTNNSGSFTVTGATSIVDTVEDAIRIADTSGAISFGQIAISNPLAPATVFGAPIPALPARASGIEISGTIGAAISIADLDIALQQDDVTGIDINGAVFNANLTIDDFDLTSTSATGTQGIDLRGVTGTGTIQIGDTDTGGADATIAGVDTGVIFDDAAEINFIFGDGEAVADVGSSIAANTAIDFTDDTGATGIYNFLDVIFPTAGSTANLESSIDIFYADQGLDGTDNGTAANPGQLDDAAAATADVIVLVDQEAAGVGTTDTIDLGSANQGAIGTLTLNDGQLLVSFRDSDSIDLTTFGFTAGGAPANILLTGITADGTTITNPNAGSGAPDLTTSAAAANVLTLAAASSTFIDGVQIVGSAGAAQAILANGASSISISNSSIGSVASSALDFADGGAATVLSLSGLTMSGGGGLSVIDLDGSGGGSLTITDFADIIVSSTGNENGAVNLEAVTFDADTGTVGIQQVAGGDMAIGSSGARVTGDGLRLNNVLGSIGFGDLDIFNDNGTALFVRDAGGKGGSFAFANSSGTIDATNGTALDIDPVAMNTVFDSVSASGGANGILLDTISGSVAINGGAISGTTGNAVDINASTLNFSYAGTIANGAARAVEITNQSAGTITFSGAIDEDGTGINLDTNTGATINFTGGLDIDSGGSASAGFRAANGGTLIVTGTNMINTTTGQVLDIQDIVIGASGVTFDSVTTTGTNGLDSIVIDDVTGGTVTLTAVDLDGTATSTGLNVMGDARSSAIVISGGTIANGVQIGQGGTGAVTIGANVSNDADTAFVVQNRGAGAGLVTMNGTVTSSVNAVNITGNSAGTVTFSNTVTGTGANSVGAVNVSGNSGGVVTFNGLVDLDMVGVGVGVNLDTNTGATINFAGGLDINGVGGAGFTATGGGTVSVTGAGNSVATTTGTAVTISGGTTIGASGVTFRSVSTNGATNGIVLNNSGASGAFTVTGTGSTLGSGGTIQNSAGSGVLLTNARNVSLTNLDITTTGLHGIQGTTITNLDLTRVRITNPGNAANENGITLVNLLGTAAAGLDSRFDSITITGAADNGIQVDNTAATSAGNLGNPDLLAIVNSTIQNSAVGGIQFISGGANGNMRLNVTGSTFTNNAAVGIATNANDGIVQASITGGNSLTPGAGTQFRGISGGATSTGQLFFNVDGNTITQNGSAGSGPSAIAYAAFDNATVNGTIADNTISSTTPGSGAGGTAVSGISVINEGSGTSAVLIEDNAISITDGFGIIANAQGGGTGSFGVTVRDNTVTVSGPDAANTALSFTNSGTAGQTICIAVTGNTLNTTPGANADILLSKSASGTFQVQGLAAADNTAPDFNADSQAVEIFLSGLQTNSVDTLVSPFGTAGYAPGTCGTPIAF
ncbi:MAG: inverse autotransporter beta domain-containing protein [Pseudomonadota bacterium]